MISLSSNGSLFTMESGVTLTLHNNVSLLGQSHYYPLVQVNIGGTLEMKAGSKISGNTSSSYGGGVYVADGTFIMSGGTISGNTSSSSSYGGGVYVDSGTFTMSGGTISGNTSSSSYGGGVCVNNGTFTKQSGGIIYGTNVLDEALKNTSQSDSYGHAVYVQSGDKKRNITAGTDVTLESGTSGEAGGWDDAA
jgi:hypothetical protein